MPTLHSARTHELSRSFLNALRTLLDAAFEGDFNDEDWQHAIGGLHVWMLDGHDVVSHGSLVSRTLQCSGHRVNAGYVEAMATGDAHRRRGYGTQIMNHLNGLIRERYQVGALSTGTHPFYETLDWTRWRGPTSVDGPGGRHRTPDDDGSIMVLRTSASPPLDLDGEIVCDWRPGDVW